MGLNLKDNNTTCGAGEIEGEWRGSCDIGGHVPQWSINSKCKTIRLSRIPHYLKNCHLKEEGTQSAHLYTHTVPFSVRHEFFLQSLTTALADESSITLVARERSDLVTSMAWPPEARARSRYSWASDWLIERGVTPWTPLRRLRLGRTSVNMKVT